MSSIVPDNLLNTVSGQTEHERAENMERLIEFLTTIVEVDLSHINGSSIVYKRDTISANNLLDLIFELIFILKQDQEENEQSIQQENEPHEETDIKTSNNLKSSNENEGTRNVNDESEMMYMRNNISCPQVEYESENDSNFKQNYSQNDLTRYEKVMTYLVNNQEEINPQEQNEFNEDYFEKIEDPAEQLEQSKSVNISRISEVSKSKENSEPHSNNKLFKQNINNSKKSESVTIKPQNSGHHKVTSLEEESSKYSMGRKNDYGTGSMASEQKYPDEEFLYDDSNIMLDQSSKSINEQSLRSKNPNMNNSERSETSEQNQNFKNNSNRSSYRSESRHKPKLIVNTSFNKKPQNNELARNSSAKRLKTSENNSFNSAIPVKEDSCSNNVNKAGEKKQEDRILKKTKSVKKLINKPVRPKSSKTDKSKDISMSSLHNNSNLKQSIASKTGEMSENDIEELPLNDENLKFEIMKEFRRIYGNKLDKILLKNNFNNSSNTLEMIVRNVRLARQKMVKVQGNNLDPDDLVVINHILLYRLKSLFRNIVMN